MLIDVIKVSVIITAYGDPIYLEKAINSVLQQTLDSFELIVVDDNDPNTEARHLTESIVHGFVSSDYNIIYVRHEHNKNGAAARNTGFSVASGKYISLLDSDDEYFTQRLEKCYNKMEKSPSHIAGVYTGCEFRRNGKAYNIHDNIQKGNFLIKTLAGTFMISTGSNIFLRKSVIDELQGFDETFIRHQDFEFLVRLFKKYSLEAIPEVLVIKNNENWNLPDVHKMIEVKEHYLNKYKSIIKNLEENEQKYIYKCHYVSIAEHALKTKQLSISHTYYKKAKEYGSLSIKEVCRKLVFTILSIFK